MINKKIQRGRKRHEQFTKFTHHEHEHGVKLRQTHELQAFVANPTNGAMKVMESQTVQQ